MVKSRLGKTLPVYYLDRLENERSGFREGTLMTLSQDEIKGVLHGLKNHQP